VAGDGEQEGNVRNASRIAYERGRTGRAAWDAQQHSLGLGGRPSVDEEPSAVAQGAHGEGRRIATSLAMGGAAENRSGAIRLIEEDAVTVADGATPVREPDVAEVRDSGVGHCVQGRLEDEALARSMVVTGSSAAEPRHRPQLAGSRDGSSGQYQGPGDRQRRRSQASSTGCGDLDQRSRLGLGGL
jgi:hypothetical protein